MEKLLNTIESAQYLGVSRPTFLRYVRLGLNPDFNFGARKGQRWTTTTLDEWKDRDRRRMEAPAVSVDAVSEFVGIGYQTLREKGFPKPYRSGNKLLVPKEEVMQWLEKFSGNRDEAAFDTRHPENHSG